MKQIFLGSKNDYISCLVKDKHIEEFKSQGFVGSINELEDEKPEKTKAKKKDS